MLERRTGPLEVRAEGRVLTGPAIRYGDVSPSHRERFEAGAFDLDGRTRWLDYRHDRERALAWTGSGLTLTDTREALMVEADLPSIPLADRALADVAAGRLTGFSVEFNAVEERRESGIRVVSRAELSGIGLVAAPSYTQSTVEIRARSGRTLRATIPAGKNLACRCSGIQCKFARLMDKAMKDIFDEFKKESSQREMIAAFGSYDSPLASLASGTLRGSLLLNGDGQVEIDIPEGVAGAATIAAHDAAGVIVRPVLDAQDSVSHLEADTRIYTSAKARAWIVSATDQREGWPNPELIATLGNLEVADASAPRRWRTWL